VHCWTALVLTRVLTLNEVSTPGYCGYLTQYNLVCVNLVNRRMHRPAPTPRGTRQNSPTGRWSTGETSEGALTVSLPAIIVKFSDQPLERLELFVEPELPRR
jgi:hypothetical protein